MKEKQVGYMKEKQFFLLTTQHSLNFTNGAAMEAFAIL